MLVCAVTEVLSSEAVVLADGEVVVDDEAVVAEDPEDGAATVPGPSGEESVGAFGVESEASEPDWPVSDDEDVDVAESSAAATPTCGPVGDRPNSAALTPAEAAPTASQRRLLRLVA